MSKSLVQMDAKSVVDLCNRTLADIQRNRERSLDREVRRIRERYCRGWRRWLKLQPPVAAVVADRLKNSDDIHSFYYPWNFAGWWAEVIAKKLLAAAAGGGLYWVSIDDLDEMALWRND